MAMALGWTALPSKSAWAVIRGETATLKYQVKKSDVILRGTCVDAGTTWTNGHVVTTYRIAAKRYLKAPAKMSLESDPVLEVVQPGGRLSGPLPLAETHPMMAAIYRGEEVVLFLTSPDSIAPGVRRRHDELVREGRMKPSPFMLKYQLTTFRLSKLTVLKDPVTKKEVVARVGPNQFSMIPTPEMVEQYVKAYESKKDFVDVKKQSQTLRVPVKLSVMRLPREKLEGRPGAAIGSPDKYIEPIEKQNEQMQSMATTWEDFQARVNSILQGTGD
jgi:predicted transport protein